MTTREHEVDELFGITEADMAELNAVAARMKVEGESSNARFIKRQKAILTFGLVLWTVIWFVPLPF